MQILFLSPRLVVPARNGAKIREYHFLRALGSTAQVTHLHFGEQGERPVSGKDLPFCQEVVEVPKPKAYSLLNAVRSVTGSWPLPILNFASPAMDAAVTDAMNRQPFDFIHLDSIHMIWYALAAVRRQPSVRVIYSWHNIESEAIRRYAAATTRFARSWYAHLTATKMERVEKSILASGFGHVVCSVRERDRLLDISPNARVAVIENGVDTGYFAADSNDKQARNRIVFVGALDYVPNCEAMIHFAERIWPQMRSRFPDLELVIVGARPGPPILALGKLPGVHVAGSVPDVRPYYQGAIAAIVPLLSGGGTRLKILESMAAGVPVISTPLGAEGLDLSDGENILIADADDANRWTDCIARLTECGDLRPKLRDAGLQLVGKHYDWQILGAKLKSVYEDWATISR